MKKIITFLYLLILAYACYDDKGNYDYRGNQPDRRGCQKWIDEFWQFGDLR